MMRLLVYYSMLVTLSCCSLWAYYDVTILGYVRFPHSLSGLPVALMESLKDDLVINFINTRPTFSDFSNLSYDVRTIIRNADPRAPSRVAFLTDHVSMPSLPDLYKKVPASVLKVAYSMVESTKIPRSWVSVLNTHFDMVVVPDEWLVEVYQEGGVTKPIFVLPYPVRLDDFLALSSKVSAHTPFAFGVSAACTSHKNLETLVRAFFRTFKNDPRIVLYIHCARGKKNQLDQLRNLVRRKNIRLHVGPYTWSEYVQFMASLDCYVLVSAGEGFSVTPREALAADIPCILSNNTAHKTLCRQFFVRAVPATIIRDAEPQSYGAGNVGKNFYCRLYEVEKALRDVYVNYPRYLSKAHLGRSWVQQYTPAALRPLYYSLFKPYNVILGAKNEIHELYIETNSLVLYRKYQSIIDRVDTLESYQ